MEKVRKDVKRCFFLIHKKSRSLKAKLMSLLTEVQFCMNDIPFQYQEHGEFCEDYFTSLIFVARMCFIHFLCR